MLNLRLAFNLSNKAAIIAALDRMTSIDIDVEPSELTKEKLVYILGKISMTDAEAEDGLKVANDFIKQANNKSEDDEDKLLLLIRTITILTRVGQPDDWSVDFTIDVICDRMNRKKLELDLGDIVFDFLNNMLIFRDTPIGGFNFWDLNIPTGINSNNPIASVTGTWVESLKDPDLLVLALTVCLFRRGSLLTRNYVIEARKLCVEKGLLDEDDVQFLTTEIPFVLKEVEFVIPNRS